MTNDEQYVPSEAEMMIAWHRHATAEDAKYARLRDDGESTTKEFVRYMARVRRDAAREALDGLARLAVQVEDGHGQLVPAERVRDDWAMVEIAARTYRDTNYPEETP